MEKVFTPIPMRYFNINSVIQEVPDEISLCINIAGCPNKCKGCSWRKTIEGMTRKELTLIDFKLILEKDKNMHSCVCFMGGEWFSDLVYFVRVAKEYGYKTCLYTGSKVINTELLGCLDYIKVGEYKEQLGGLDSPSTNQRFLTIGDKTKCFQKNK